MHKLMEFVCDELEELEHKVAKEGKLSRTDLEDVKNLSEVKKNILKIEMLSEGSEYSNAMGGYSRRDGYSRRMSYADGGSYGDMSYADEGRGDFVRPDGSYRDGGSSYARGRGSGARRDSMGRYSSEGGVDEKTKEELRKLIEKM